MPGVQGGSSLAPVQSALLRNIIEPEEKFERRPVLTL
jgi:hypothetical protein